MSFVYVLVFVLMDNDPRISGVLELKEYDTWESCRAAAIASFDETAIQQLRAGYSASGWYKCIAKPD